MRRYFLRALALTFTLRGDSRKHHGHGKAFERSVYGTCAGCNVQPTSQSVYSNFSSCSYAWYTEITRRSVCLGRCYGFRIKSHRLQRMGTVPAVYPPVVRPARPSHRTGWAAGFLLYRPSAISPSRSRPRSNDPPDVRSAPWHPSCRIQGESSGAGSLGAARLWAFRGCWSTASSPSAALRGLCP